MGGDAAGVLGLFLGGVEEFWELGVTAFGGKVGAGRRRIQPRARRSLGRYRAYLDPLRAGFWYF
jgi:hypothetical protein